MSKSARPRITRKPVSKTKRPVKHSNAKQPQDTAQAYDAQKLAENMTKTSDLWQRIMQILAQQNLAQGSVGHTDPLSFAESMLRSMRHVQLDPEQMMQLGLNLASDHTQLLRSMTDKMLGRSERNMVDVKQRDKRFRDDAWQESPWFDYLRQSYLINARWLMQSTNSMQGLSAHDQHKLQFFMRQWVDALSPSNFALTNPEVLRATFETNGENLVKGLKKLLADLEKGGGKLRISMTDEKAFTLGKNLATTKGSVVYQNDLMQLIQFAPSTKQVYEVPILVVPAWINKYYILDLSEDNSLVRWLTDQGFTVFVISWVNPDKKLAAKTFEDYMNEGTLAALDVVQDICKSKKVHIAGYCLGGTLTAVTIAYLRAKRADACIASATYITTLIDFAHAGDLSVFIDDLQLESLENRMQETGYLEGADMAHTFNMLRANDLIWSFVINNYLLGKDPLPFDMLYWNSDSTRMPAAMHAFYLRKMYKENALMRAGGIELSGVPINVTKITTPSYILATRDDHIAPWQSTYAATQIYDGPVRFTLADSGHVAGVINSPTRNKYCYWVYEDLPPKPEDWLEGAKQKEGSWWPDWLNFSLPLSGKKITARTIGNAKYKPIEAAPGAYAKVRA